MTPIKQWVKVQNWKDIRFHLDMPPPASFFISASVLKRLGAPTVRAYQDALPSPHFDLLVECETRGHALLCIYHGIARILYRGTQKGKELQSISNQMNAQLTYRVD